MEAIENPVTGGPIGGAEKTGAGVELSGGGGKDTGEEKDGKGLLKTAGADVGRGGSNPPEARVGGRVNGRGAEVLMGGMVEGGRGEEKVG